MSSQPFILLEQACFGADAWSAAQVEGALGRRGAVSELVPDVGYVLGGVVADEAELHRIGVQPGMRRCGAGRALLRSFLKSVTAAGATRLFLEVREDNQAARRLYEATGMNELGRRPRYYSDGCAALVMGMELPSGVAP